MKIFQPKDGFRYNSDSLLLYDFASFGTPKGDILDIGCGSGVVGLLLARDFNVNLFGVDKQEQMIECSVKSASANNINAEFVCTDIEDFKSDKKFSMIISNPPFYPSMGTKSQNESKNIARYEENMPFSLLVKKANAHIHNRGSFVFCYEARALQDIAGELKTSKFYISRVQFVHPDSKKEARLVLIEACKYKKGMMNIMPPIFMDDEEYLKSLREKAKTVSVE